MISHRTRSLFLIALGHLAVELSSQFLPAVYPVLISTLGLSYTQVGTIALVAGVGTSLAQPFFGYLSDRWDPRHTSALGIAWIGLIMGAVGLTANYAMLVLIVGLGALGSAAFHPPAATIASACGGMRRGAAVSVFSIGGSVGSALSPLWVTAGMRWLGIRGTLLLIPVALLISALLHRGLGQMPRSGDVYPEERQTPVNKGAVVSLILIVMAVMSLAWLQQTFKTYLPIWIQNQGGSVEVGARMLFTLFASSGIGSLIGGALSDRLGRWQLYALCLGLLGPAVWLFVAVSGSLQGMTVVMMGVLIGATFPLSIVIAQETWPSRVGIASGLVMGLGWAPGGIGAWITGLVADHFSLAAGLRLLAVPTVLGTACILAYAMVQRSSPGKA